MPVDSTQIKLGETERQILFTHSSLLTDALTLLYEQWSRVTKQQTPTVYDAMAVAFAGQPQLCPVTRLHLEVDAKGLTRETPGPVNAQVFLDSSTDQFFASTCLVCSANHNAAPDATEVVGTLAFIME